MNFQISELDSYSVALLNLNILTFVKVIFFFNLAVLAVNWFFLVICFKKLTAVCFKKSAVVICFKYSAVVNYFTDSAVICFYSIAFCFSLTAIKI